MKISIPIDFLPPPPSKFSFKMNPLAYGFKKKTPKHYNKVIWNIGSDSLKMIKNWWVYVYTKYIILSCTL